MARRFDEAERERIREKLIASGKAWFGKVGLKKTSVEDLTKDAGIAQGSFYLFFSSKEELYFDILQEEEKRLQDKVTGKLLETQQSSADSVRAFVKEMFAVVEASPVLKDIYSEDVMNRIVRKLPKEKLEQNFNRDADALQPVVQRWQQNGQMIDADPALIVSLLRSLLLLSLHKKEIGEHLYEDTIALLSEVVARGLMK